VGDRRVEQAVEQVGEVGGVARRDADVVKSHTLRIERRQLIRTERGSAPSRFPPRSKDLDASPRQGKRFHP